MPNRVHLIEETLRRGLGQLSHSGALVVETGAFTGRAADKRYITRYPEGSPEWKKTDRKIHWGPVNKAVESRFSDDVFSRVQEKLNSLDHSDASKRKKFQYNGYVSGLPVEVQSTSPWHILFARNMFRDKPVEGLAKRAQEFLKIEKIQILHDPNGKLSDLGLTSTGPENETIIILDPARMRVAIVGTAYAGEIKKSAFTLCNFILPELGFFPMHSSANCFQDGTETSILFGLSGTGKTTLSADPDRWLIGDDEIVWTPSGLSNLEGGCYAKLIRLSEESEPVIHRAVKQFGSILENVVCESDSRDLDFDDDSKTENTRGSYSIEAVEKRFDQSREASPPKTVIFLTADAFGALPAVAKLNSDQAQYHFISGYTAKVAGTEIGVKEPKAAFSACFGAPFMPRHPAAYAKLLSKYTSQTNASVWMLNTGWTGGGYGKGDRFPISVSRKLLSLIQSGELEKAEMTRHPVFGFDVPKAFEGIDPKWLSIPMGTKVVELAEKFEKNFKKFEDQVDPDVALKGGPIIGRAQEKALLLQLNRVGKPSLSSPEPTFEVRTSKVGYTLKQLLV